MPQMRTSALPDNHPVKHLVGLSRQIALPHEYSPERFPSFPALERTAKLGFNQPTTIDVPASTTRKFALCRQAAYPVWAERTTTGSDGYVVTYATAATTNVNTPGQTEVTVVFDQCLYQWLNTNVTAGSTTVGAAGLPVTPNVFQYAILGVDALTGPRPWVYVPPNANLTYVLRSGGVNPTWQAGVTLEIWDAPGECHTMALLSPIVIGNTGASAVTTSATGWVRPTVAMVSAGGGVQNDQYYLDLVVTLGSASYNASALNAGTITFASATNTYFLPVVAPSEYRNSQLPWYSARVTAAALLATNVTTVLNKGGTILAGRVSPQVLSPWAVTSSTINMLHPAEKAFLPLETGLYTYCPPSTDMANFWDYTLPNVVQSGQPAVLVAPVYRLDNDAMVNYAFITSPSNIESLALNVDWHIEFRTSSALFDVGMSTVTLETLHQAQLVLASVGFFFENFDHKAILSAVISAAKKYGPAMAGVISPLAGQVAEYVLSKIPQPGMTTTTIPVLQPQSPQPRIPRIVPSVDPPQHAARERRKRKDKRRDRPRSPPKPSSGQKNRSGLDMYLAHRNKP